MDLSGLRVKGLNFYSPVKPGVRAYSDLERSVGNTALLISQMRKLRHGDKGGRLVHGHRASLSDSEQEHSPALSTPKHFFLQHSLLESKVEISAGRKTKSKRELLVGRGKRCRKTGNRK